MSWDSLFGFLGVGLFLAAPIAVVVQGERRQNRLLGPLRRDPTKIAKVQNGQSVVVRGKILRAEPPLHLDPKCPWLLRVQPGDGKEIHARLTVEDDTGSIAIHLGPGRLEVFHREAQVTRWHERPGARPELKTGDIVSAAGMVVAEADPGAANAGLRDQASRLMIVASHVWRDKVFWYNPETDEG
jgi:hypothetical protein